MMSSERASSPKHKMLQFITRGIITEFFAPTVFAAVENDGGSTEAAAAAIVTIRRRRPGISGKTM